MHKRMCITVLFFTLLLSSLISGQQSAGLSIEQAVKLAMDNNPELRVLEYEIEALKKVKLQKGLIPNPELEIELEDILGSDEFTGFSNNEITAVVSQDIILAGKLSKEQKITDTDILLARNDYLAKQLEIVTDVKKTFTEALAAQQLINKNKEMLGLSDKLIAGLETRVNAGKISPAEVSRAKIILSSLRLELAGLTTQYEIHKAGLASLLFTPEVDIDSLSGEISLENQLPEFELLLTSLDNNPALARFETEYSRQDAVIMFEEAKRIPDLNISAGVKYLNEAKAHSFIIGASVPLPFFNRNQGNIEEAQIRGIQKKEEYKALRNRLTVKLKILYNNYTNLLNTARKLKNESIPEAEEVFRIINEGNLTGRFAIIDVLDAEKTLFELQNQYLSLVGNLETSRIEIEGLLGIEMNKEFKDEK